MFCSNCGAKINDDEIFCPSCGTKQPEAEAVKEEPENGFNPIPNIPIPNIPIPNVPIPNVPIPGINNETANWKDSKFDGGFWGLFGVSFLFVFVSIITLGFAYPAMYCFRLKWFYKHTIVGGYRLGFNGKGRQLFGKYILWTFLSIITFGIFALWLPIKYKKWEIKHVEIVGKA